MSTAVPEILFPSTSDGSSTVCVIWYLSLPLLVAEPYSKEAIGSEFVSLVCPAAPSCERNGAVGAWCRVRKVLQLVTTKALWQTGASRPAVYVNASEGAETGEGLVAQH